MRRTGRKPNARKQKRIRVLEQRVNRLRAGLGRIALEDPDDPALIAKNVLLADIEIRDAGGLDAAMDTINRTVD